MKDCQGGTSSQAASHVCKSSPRCVVRKWPRLLVDKKSKISNMHLWMEMQELWWDILADSGKAAACFAPQSSGGVRDRTVLEGFQGVRLVRE